MTEKQIINQILARLRRLESRAGNAPSNAQWGNITGLLSNQTDLQNELNEKQSSNANLSSWASVVRAGNFDAFANAPTSFNLKSLVSDETGSGSLVFATSPTLSGFTNNSGITFSSGSTFTYESGIAQAHRNSLLGEILKYDPNIAAARTNPTTPAADDVLTGMNLTAGIWEISFYFSFNSGTCGVQPSFLFGTTASVGIATNNLALGPYYRGGNVVAGIPYATATGIMNMVASPAASQTDFQYAGTFMIPLTGNTTFGMRYAVASSVAGQTVTRRANAFLRARKVN